MRFDELELATPLLRAIAKEGYETPTPIQAEAIPHVLRGRDVLGSAQTGTGKTAAFALPMLHRLASGRGGGKRGRAARPRALVLCPTRELASQIAGAMDTYGAHLAWRSAVIFGGVPQRGQVSKLRRGVDAIIATPGRLLDLLDQGHVDLGAIETLVLDEADRMLDMGFIHDIRKIVAHAPRDRQTLLFSATMPRAIHGLADTLLTRPAVVKPARESARAARVEQRVYFVERKNKPILLAELTRTLPMRRTIVFTRTKHGADKLVRLLGRDGITAEAIHGDKSQNRRERSLKRFRTGGVHVLVATDVAARGIDVGGITHVVNYDLTHEPEMYVHRIGRTARAGAAGEAISFCDRDEVRNLRAIERLLRETIPVCEDHPPYPEGNAAAPTKPERRPPHPMAKKGRVEGGNRKKGGRSRARRPAEKGGPRPKNGKGGIKRGAKHIRKSARRG